MVRYIDKAAVVAEINRQHKILMQTDHTYGAQFVLGFRQACRQIIDFLDTLEVKEVDFETAFVASNDHFDEKNNYGRWSESDLRQFAKHFFELGLKTTKEE